MQNIFSFIAVWATPSALADGYRKENNMASAKTCIWLKPYFDVILVPSAKADGVAQTAMNSF